MSTTDSAPTPITPTTPAPLSSSETPPQPPAPSPNSPNSPETRQNPTNPDTSPRATRPLSSRQFSAISLILAGHTDADIAAALNLSRQTVCDWRNHHPAFIAELNRQRQHRHAATADRYDRLLNRAMDIIESAQDGTHLYTHQKARLATSLLSTGRRSLAPTTGPTSPSDILQSLLAQGLAPAPDDADPANDESRGVSPGGAQGGHGGGTGVARGVHEGGTGGARDPLNPQIPPPQ